MQDSLKFFNVKVLSLGKKENEVLTRARLSIFYKYANPNGTYITDDFAEKLLSSIPYSPIKGIRDELDLDFTDHGERRDEGRIIGIVPVDYNLEWESIRGEDGISREFACVDVLLFTALYKEASEVVGKSQSMELYVPSIQGEWVNHEGKMLYEYSDACFLGLQVLGDDVEPCFDGAQFFSLGNDAYSNINMLNAIFSKIEKLELELQDKKSQNTGGTKMSKNLFVLSDEQKRNKISLALNTDEEYRYYVEETYDSYAIVRDWKKDSSYKVNYSKENETVKVSEKDSWVAVKPIYVTAEESTAIDALREIKGTFTELVTEFKAKDEKIESLASKEEEISALNTKIQEQDETISTLTIEKETVETEVATLTAENTALAEFKEEKEKAEKAAEEASKEEVLSEFSEKLNLEIIESYRAKKSEFTSQELAKELAYELVKGGGVAGLFTNAGANGYVPSDDSDPEDNLVALMSKYSKK